MAERKVVIVRLRPALHAALQRWAAAEFRSVNGQIEYLLKQAVAKRTSGGRQIDEPQHSAAPPEPSS